VPLWNNLKHERGPFDVIGDIHGCCDELEKLLGQLGYARESSEAPFGHPGGRKAVFVGDLVDRGPRILDTLNLVRQMVRAGTALCVPGNHEVKLLRKLNGKDIRITHGLAQTLSEIDGLPDDRRDAYVNELKEFLDSLVSHYVFDGGKLVVAHAGLNADL